jgi:uncharacterized SAM-binding protein YcdF (DUF218 family)
MKKHPILTICLAAVAAAVLAFAITGAVIMGASGGIEGSFDYLIVLGTTVNGTEPSSMLQDRIDAAYAWLTAHPDAVCIVSGGMADEVNISEAQCMFNELTGMGISPDRIRMEDRATSTLENLEFSLALIEAETGSRPESVGILSSEFHLLRAEMFARRQGITAVTVPAKTSDPGTFAYYFLREIIMVWYYSTIGA